MENDFGFGESIPLTPCFSGGVERCPEFFNRFSGLARQETAEAVLVIATANITPLKQGVNEMTVNDVLFHHGSSHFFDIARHGD
ncbi:MAG: hypothetical protein ACLQSR_01655 [Limisphaerales bacterium]